MLWETYTRNTRQQLKDISVGTAPGASDVYRVAYDFAPQGAPTKNNGDVRTEHIYVPGLSAKHIAYSYDELDRVTAAVELDAASNLVWKQGFTYDRFGNRAINMGETSAAFVGDNPQTDPLTNRISPAPASSTSTTPRATSSGTSPGTPSALTATAACAPATAARLRPGDNLPV